MKFIIPCECGFNFLGIIFLYFIKFSLKNSITHNYSNSNHIHTLINKFLPSQKFNFRILFNQKVNKSLEPIISFYSLQTTARQLKLIIT